MKELAPLLKKIEDTRKAIDDNQDNPAKILNLQSELTNMIISYLEMLKKSKQC